MSFFLLSNNATFISNQNPLVEFQFQHHH